MRACQKVEFGLGGLLGVDVQGAKPAIAGDNGSIGPTSAWVRTVFRYFLKVLIFLVIVAISATAYLLATQGRALDWRQLAVFPEFRWPVLETPDWARWKFWEREPVQPAVAAPGARWVVRPGEEPPEFAPFIPGEGVQSQFPPGTFFRWQDGTGGWQYTQQPQPGVRNYPVATDPARNILPSEER